MDKKILQDLAQQGIMELSPAKIVEVVRELAKSDAGIAVAIAVSNLAIDAVRRYAPALFHPGRWTSGCFALTEEEAGSDPRALNCRAEREGEQWRLFGKKWLITNGDLADLCVTFAKTTKGISAFAITNPTWKVTKVFHKLGLDSVQLTEIDLTGCKAILLGKEGKGLNIALESLDQGRLTVSGQAVGIAEASFSLACEHANQREVFGKKLIEHESVAFTLAELATELEAATLLLSRKQQDTISIAKTKLFCTKTAVNITDHTVQLFGGVGYLYDHPAMQLFRHARATTIYEGTSEIQKLVISRSFVL